MSRKGHKYPIERTAASLGARPLLSCLRWKWTALRRLPRIDQLMDMAHTSLNVLGNRLATVVISRWEGHFGKEVLSPVVTSAPAG